MVLNDIFDTSLVFATFEYFFQHSRISAVSSGCGEPPSPSLVVRHPADLKFTVHVVEHLPFNPTDKDVFGHEAVDVGADLIVDQAKKSKIDFVSVGFINDLRIRRCRVPEISRLSKACTSTRIW